MSIKKTSYSENKMPTFRLLDLNKTFELVMVKELEEIEDLRKLGLTEDKIAENRLSLLKNYCDRGIVERWLIEI
jgi:hypothetical protein